MADKCALAPPIATGVPVTSSAMLAHASNPPLAMMTVTREELERLKKEMEASNTDMITMPCFLHGLVEGQRGCLRPTELAVFRAFLGDDFK